MRPSFCSAPAALSRTALRLARGALVSGRVLDQDGLPMAAVPVSVVGLVSGRDEVIVLPGALPTAAEAAELPLGSVARPGSIRTALSDAQGHFELRGLAPGRSRLEVLAPDKLPLRREPLLLAPGDARDLGDLVVPTGVLLSGRVLDQDGQVLPGAQVEARPAGRRLVPPSGSHPTRKASSPFACRWANIPWLPRPRTMLLSPSLWCAPWGTQIRWSSGWHPGLAPTADCRQRKERQHPDDSATSGLRRVGAAAACLGFRRSEADEVAGVGIDIARALHVIGRQAAQFNFCAGESTETYIVAPVTVAGRLPELQAGTGLPLLSTGHGSGVPSAWKPGVKQV